MTENTTVTETNAYTYKLDEFEGPLDLCLTLISKHKLDILNIRISVLCEQFTAYLEEALKRDNSLLFTNEQAGEFLATAAHLIYIKTLAMLPRHEREAAEKLIRELSGRLIEYQLVKEAANALREDYIGSMRFGKRASELPDGNLYRLSHDKALLLKLILRLKNGNKPSGKKDLPPPSAEPPADTRVFAPVGAKVFHILKTLRKNGRASLDALMSGRSRTEKVALFLAILELSKYARISISDDDKYLTLCNRAPPS